jgi:hypothetical protein
MTTLKVIVLFIVRWSHAPVTFWPLVVMRDLNRCQVACGAICWLLGVVKL